MLSASDAPSDWGSTTEYIIDKVPLSQQITPRAILQTRDGYLWVGTYKGLNRFDGIRQLTFDVVNTPTLSSDAVGVLYEDRSGDLWAGTDDGGVIRYRQGTFQAFGPAQGLTSSEVSAICEDLAGKLWVGTRHGLFHRIEERFAELPSTNFLTKARISALVPAADGTLWVGTSRGLFRLEGDNTEPVAVVTNRYVEALAMDRHGVLWAALDSRSNARIMGDQVNWLPFRYAWFQPGNPGSFWLAGTRGTLFRLNEETNTTVVARFDQRRLSALCEDLEGNIWVGLESHGLYRVRRKQVKTLSTREGLATDAVTTILEDRNGRVWLGTFGWGLFAAESGSMTFARVPIPSVANITALHERAEGTLWLGTFNGGRYVRDGTRFVEGDKGSPGCRAVYEDRAGGLWIGTLLNGVEQHCDGKLKQRYTTRDGLASDRIQCLVQDASGDMWIGSARGLNRISAGKVVPFPGEDPLARQTIRALHVDRRGALWIGTTGSGLARFYKDQFQSVTSRHGLASDGVEQILEDDDGFFWLGTWEGIVRVSRDELDACAEGRQPYLKAMTLGPEDGMSMAGCGTGFQPSCMKTRSGTLWFCTAGGLVVLDPKTVKPNPQAPPVYIEQAAADDRSLPFAARTITVPPGVGRVAFRYTALSFSAPDKIRFRYRLESYDEGWIDAGTAREAVYTRLPAGKYHFRVSAGNKDGAWNTTGAVLGVTVLPPWWQSWWFRAMAFASLTGMVFGAYELRIYQHKKARVAQEVFARRLIESQEQERKRVAGELHDSLGQSLQIIKGRALLGLNRAGDPSEGAKQFEEISNAAGQAIREVRAISHALRPAELDQLGLGKAIEWMVEQAGTTSKTRCACELEAVDEIPSEMEISIYRMAQEGLNNVLKHANATEAILELKREGNTVRFSIFDNGRGFAKPVRPSGHGLIGIAERVRLLGGQFDIQSAPDRGTRLTATIPVKTNER